MSKINWMIVSIIAIIVILYGCFAFYAFSIWNTNSSESIGTYGDSFGTINALFSGLALGGIIYTIILQQKELKETREIFLVQSFDTKFFKLIEIYINLKRQINERYSNNSQIDFFQSFYKQIEGKEFKTKDELVLIILDTLSSEHFESHLNYFLNYKFLIHSLIRLIGSSVKVIDVSTYSAILKGQMSIFETQILILELYRNDNDKFISLLGLDDMIMDSRVRELVKISLS